MVHTSLRFRLRKLELKDADSLAVNTNDASIAMNLLDIDLPYTKKNSLNWIKTARKEYTKKKPERLYLGIAINGKAVGEVGLYDIDYEHKKAEIMFWLGKDYRGQGIVKKAVKQMLDYGFKKLGLVRIFATVFVKNKPSAKLLENLGFEYEGKHRKVTFKDGEHLDEYTYAIVK